MSILVLNAGSSSLKFSVFAQDADPVASGLIDWKGGQEASLTITRTGADRKQYPVQVAGYRDAMARILDALRAEKVLTPAQPVAAVGHRVVHGGAEFRGSVRIDAHVLATIERLIALAPLHNPPALEVMRAAEQALPGIPSVAVFDTAFHASLPPSTFLYPVPYPWYEQWGVRRFGFHGISVAYCAGRAAEMLGRAAQEVRLIICHLGNGCSATAVKNGASIATTMGFTPLEGLMMGTRSGSVDPGLLLNLLEQGKLDARQLDQALNHESGLLGISGVSSDYRLVETAANQGNERARLALEMFAGRVRLTIGALAVQLGGVDALVFTAGVGENSSSLRKNACIGLECLGLRLDEAKNTACKPDTDIAASSSSGRILVIRTREDLLIARETRKVVEVN
jgi:acetate kinase